MTQRKNNKIPFLPKIKGISKSNSEYSLINVSATTNASVIKNNSTANSSIPCKSHRILKKIIKSNNISQRPINNSQIYSYNQKNKISKIIQNADEIMKERGKFHELELMERKYLLRKPAVNLSKDISYKNYYISLLKEKRIDINKRELIIRKNLDEYAELYEKDYRKFMNFVEDMKAKERLDFETLTEFRQKREEKEKLYENEKSLNKKLDEKLERIMKELYRIKAYGSFIHQLLEKDFIYDGIPELKLRDKNYEEISDLLINIYETKDKFNNLPKEIEDVEFLTKKYIGLEDKVISGIYKKEITEKEIERVKKRNNKNLQQLKLSESVYESDLNFLKNERQNIIIDMNNYKIHEDENLEDYLKFIIELGKEIETKGEIPKVANKNFSTDLAFYSEKVLQKLKGLEDIINKNILEIGNVLEFGNKNDKELMEKIIQNQININKKERQLENKLKQEKLKLLEISKIFKRGEKKVITGRKVIFDYPFNKNKIKLSKIVDKEDDDTIDYQYSESIGENIYS